MEIPNDLEDRIGKWELLSRWDRSEIGRDLRRLGLSYGEIRKLIDVKKSTLATWCREIKLTEEQKQAILSRTDSRAGIPVDTQWKRRLEVEGMRKTAYQEIANKKYHPLWVAGVILYWAEGNKTQPMLGITNSDPRAIRLFVSWCRTYHEPDAEFTMKLNLHADNDEREALRWWARESGLVAPDFYRTFIKPDGTGHRKNHLSHGVCMIRMRRSADAFHTTIAWIDGLVDYFDTTNRPSRIYASRAAGAIGSAEAS